MATKKLGQQELRYVVAEPGGVAEKVLRIIATEHEGIEGRFTRKPWRWSTNCAGEICELRIYVPGADGGGVRILVVAIGKNFSMPPDATYVLRDVSRGKARFSLRGGWVCQSITESQIRSVAFQLTAALCRGTGWMDSEGNVHDNPYGPSGRGKKKKNKRKTRSRRSRRHHDQYVLAAY